MLDAKQILKDVNGHFRSGNLIGILGPSGAGKTTLLNVLAGYINNANISGQIVVNNEPRNMHKFKKVSCYIMQEDVLQKQLSVLELMNLAADLKLGSRFTAKEKSKIVMTVVQTIGLESCLKTRTESLSGGQSKRLAIALELIDNPPVMFLDEPTTGLDNVVAKQCIQLLKTLADQGRTIICTIHQPPDSLFNCFDQVYFMSQGYCIYSGSVPQMVPFLEAVNLPCATYSSPADYIIELVSTDASRVPILTQATNNGRTTRITPKDDRMTIFQNRQTTYTNIFAANCDNDGEKFQNSYLRQISILFRRMCVQMSRNKLMLTIQLAHHIISGLSLGLSFYRIGNDASQILANFKFLIAIMVFYCYTYIMSPILLFPFEIELIKREYFNRWYSLKAYYTALTLSNIPIMVLFSVIFNVIIYTVTGQPMDVRRFFFFNVICILTSLTAYGFGVTIGSIFKPTVGACVGSTIGMYLIVMCIHDMGYGDTIPMPVKVLMLMTFPRQGLNGLCVALLRGRPLMDCENELFCFIRDPEELLQLMGMGGVNLYWTIGFLFGFLIMHRIAAYIALRWKVSGSESKGIFKYL
ncbi:hypothetical protein Trydic_g5263 [Trypoxylus dichotomus]